MFFIYNLISTFFLIISPIIVIYRIAIGKEDKIRFLERYAISSKKRKKGKLVWFHCSSVGELLSILPLFFQHQSMQFFLHSAPLLVGRSPITNISRGNLWRALFLPHHFPIFPFVDSSGQSNTMVIG